MADNSFNANVGSFMGWKDLLPERPLWVMP